MPQCSIDALLYLDAAQRVTRQFFVGNKHLQSQANSDYIFVFDRMRVKKLPHILALHLKRFKYMEQVNRYTKLSYRVVFPLELRLFNTVSLSF